VAKKTDSYIIFIRRIHKAIFVKLREHLQIFSKIKNRSRIDQKTQYFTYSEGFATK